MQRKLDSVAGLIACALVACSEEPCPDLDYDESDAVIRGWVEVEEWGEETLEDNGSGYSLPPNDLTEARLIFRADGEPLLDEVVPIDEQVCLLAPAGANISMNASATSSWRYYSEAGDTWCDGGTSHEAEIGKVIDLRVVIECAHIY